MKKKSERRIITAIVTGIAAVAAFACGAVLSACGGSSKILETPTNLQIADEYLTWDEVADAKSYVVEINGEEYTTQTNSLDILEITSRPITYKFTVFAIGDNKKNYDSDPSEEIEYKVEAAKNLIYKNLTDGTCEVSAINTEESRSEMTGKLIIPEVYDGRSVVSIAANGFRQCQNITAVYIPDSVQTVGAAAFAKCTSLTRAKLPEYLQIVGKNTFNGSAIKEIEIPSAVTDIKDTAFGYCKSLESITFNEGLITVGGQAFVSCESLTSLHLPASLQDFSKSAILFCKNLVNLSVARGENATFISDGNCLINKADSTLVIGCAGSVIPDYVTTIGYSAFYGCSISEIKLPSSLREIEQSAFQYCENLKSIVIPEGVTEMGSHVFKHCINLESVSLPSTLKSLTNYLGMLEYCNKIKSLTVNENNHYYKSDGNCIIRKADNVLVMGCAASVIPDYATVIGDHAFSCCFGVDSDVIDKEEGIDFIIPAGVKVIENYAFFGCNLFKCVYIPSSVDTIGDGAFNSCILTSIVIPSGVKTIGSTAFGKCIIYTDYTYYDFPEGWSTHWKDGSYYSVSCVLNYDSEGYPYVKSVSRGNGSNVYSISVGYRESVIPAPYRRGYMFLGWEEAEKSNQVKYAVEQKTFEFTVDVSLSGQPITKTVEGFAATQDYKGGWIFALYAVWQKND